MTPISYSITLIGKNKIREYIQKFQEVETALLLWYKCFAYREGSIDRYQEHPITNSILYGSSNLDTIDYSVFYKINPWLKVAFIDFVGTQEQAKQWHLEKIRSKYPDEEIITETIVTETVELDIDDEYFLDPDLPTKENDVDETIPEVHFFPYKSNYNTWTAIDYEAVLNRTYDLFESKPGSSDFEELSGLIGAITVYEDKAIQIPELDAIEIIKWQMKVYQDAPAFMLHIFTTETEVTDFLAGKTAISLKQLKALCKHYRIQFLYPELEENLRERKMIN